MSKMSKTALRCLSKQLCAANSQLLFRQHGFASMLEGTTFKADDLRIELINPENSNLKHIPDAENLEFGYYFSDHMLTVGWSSEGGWTKPYIHPLREIKLHPGAQVLHYAIGCFDGLKAYRCDDNQVRLFRPHEVTQRLVKSARRCVLPTFDSKELVKCISKLVSIDQKFVPEHPLTSMYIRPTLIGTEAHVGLSRSKTARLNVITSPVGPYFKSEFEAVSILADPQYVRVPEGGVGSYKVGSNYGPTIYTQIEALKKYGCHQVLWLYGNNEQITEFGSMNFFVYWINKQGETELLTPPLDTGLILPGVTRMSILELCRSWNEFKVTEKEITMGDLIEALNDNRILEIFGSGTAGAVCPVGDIHYKGDVLQVPTMSNGAPLSTKLLNTLNDIQHGRIKSDWLVDVDEADLQSQGLKQTQAKSID